MDVSVSFGSYITSRSSRPEVPCKRGVLRNFTKVTGKHLCQSLSFYKVAGLSPATLLTKKLWHRCFPVNFMKFLRTPFLTEHFWWLLLYLRQTAEAVAQRCSKGVLKNCTKFTENTCVRAWSL